VLRVNDRRAELQRGRVPLPIATTKPAGERKHFAEQFGLGRRCDFKFAGEFRRVAANFLVYHHGKIQRQLRGGVTATAVNTSEFVKADAAGIAAQIEQSRADVLWVALGAPKQELWVANHAGKINVPLMLAVGAAFDFHSGNRKWAPAWIRKIGMEWAFRTLTGGRRVFIRNARNVPMFTWVILKQIVGHWCARLSGTKRSLA